jgi:hypothetical protein
VSLGARADAGDGARRYLLVLNEPEPGAFPDVRDAFDGYVAEGLLDEYRVYPHTARGNDGLDGDQVGAELVELAREHEPAVVLWFHTGRLALQQGALHGIRSSPGRPLFGYVEGDEYHWLYKPAPRQMLSLAAACDAAFLVADALLAAELRRRGCGDVLYIPSATDDVRFGAPLDPDAEPEWDAVVVGSNVRPRFGLLRDWPGMRLRRAVVELLARRLGSRFAVFGPGWTGPCAKGPIPFTRQDEAYRNARVGVGTQALTVPPGRYAFSNRLPIMLGSGSLVAYSRGVGYEELFPPGNPVWFGDAEDAWRQVRGLLDLDDGEALARRRSGQRLALDAFAIKHVYRYVVEVMNERLAARADGRAVRPVPNPWLPGVTIGASRK